MTSTGHGVTVDLGLDVDSLLGVGLQPGDVNLNIEVTNAEYSIRNQREK